MTDSMEEELNALWLEVETLTSIKYLKRKTPPKVSDQFSDKTNEVIEYLFISLLCKGHILLEGVPGLFALNSLQLTLHFSFMLFDSSFRFLDLSKKSEV